MFSEVSNTAGIVHSCDPLGPYIAIGLIFKNNCNSREYMYIHTHNIVFLKREITEERQL